MAASAPARLTQRATAVGLGVLLVADLAALVAIGSASTPAADFELYRAVVARGTDLFAIPGYRWSPLAFYPLILVVAIGLPAWQLLHLAALAALRDWRLILFTLLAFPFWKDVQLGSGFIFVVVAAVAAYRGSRIGALAYFALLLLTPRPLMAPLAAWLLWKHPTWRWPVLAAGLVEIAVLAAMGTLVPWLQVLAATSGDEILNPTNLGPSAIIGGWWLLVGIPLSVWLTVRGRLGLASLAASPYWLPYYLLFGLLELVRPGTTPSPRPMTPAGPSG